MVVRVGRGAGAADRSVEQIGMLHDCASCGLRAFHQAPNGCVCTTPGGPRTVGPIWYVSSFTLHLRRACLAFAAGPLTPLLSERRFRPEFCSGQVWPSVRLRVRRRDGAERFSFPSGEPPRQAHDPVAQHSAGISISQQFPSVTVIRLGVPSPPRRLKRSSTLCVPSQEEARAPALYWNVAQRCRAQRIEPPRLEALLTALRDKGFVACRTHFDAHGVRTSAPLRVLDDTLVALTARRQSHAA